MNKDEKIASIKTWLGSGSINVFGRPFAGKDYQGKILQELIDGHLIGGGEILRGSKMPDHIKQIMKTGELIPSNDYVNIVLPFLNQPRLANKPLILSSVGRWHGEEDGVIEALKESNHPLKAVIYLDISNEDSHNRLKALNIYHDRESRNDDTEELLKTRFDEFNTKTVPVIDFYRNTGLLIELDGSKTRDEVTKDIIEALYRQALA